MNMDVVKHVVRGALMLGIAAFITDLASDVQLLGLSATNAALVSAVLGAIDSWLHAEAEKS